MLFAVLMAAAGAAFIAEPGPSATSAGSADNPTDSSDDGDSSDDDDSSDDEPDAVAPTGTAAARTSITLAFTGDTLVHESVADSAAADAGVDPGGTEYDFSPMFDDVAGVISGADLAVCHMETPISATNTDLSYFPAFRVPSQIADAVAGAGFDACSAASNHALDAGPAGVSSTIAQLRRAGIDSAGTATDAADAARARLYDIDGVVIGHLSAAYGLNEGYQVPVDQPWLVELTEASTLALQARELRIAGADIVVLSLHWGIEYQSEPTEEQRSLAAQLLALHEVDLIVGHHAHVVQPIERIGNKYVAYGLGNFLSNQSPDADASLPTNSQDGAIVLVTFGLDAGGSWAATRVEAVPTWVDRTNGHVIRRVDEPAPEIDPSVAEASRARTLAVLDANGALTAD